METIILDARRWIWKLDISGMVCFNEENEVVIKFTKEGKEIKGKMLDMSMELFGKIAVHKNGPKIIQQIIFAAEEEYCRKNSAYAESFHGA